VNVEGGRFCAGPWVQRPDLDGWNDIGMAAVVHAVLGCASALRRDPAGLVDALGDPRQRVLSDPANVEIRSGN
jgi:hypothetical protein